MSDFTVLGWLSIIQLVVVTAFGVRHVWRRDVQPAIRTYLHLDHRTQRRLNWR